MRNQHDFNNAITTLSKLIQSSDTFVDKMLSEPEKISSRQINLFKKAIAAMNDEIQVLQSVYKSLYYDSKELNDDL